MRYEFKLPDIGEGMVEGEIVKWHVKVGDEVEVDAPMLDVMTDKATVTISAPKKGKVLELGAKEGEVKKVGAVLIALEVGTVPPGSPRSSESQDGKSHPSAPSPPSSAKGALASPATRRLAQELGVDLSRVSGSGPGGRVTDGDVRAFQGGGASVSTVPRPASGGKEERIAFRGLRRKIAEKMTASKTHIPHFTFVDEADVTELVALRDKMDAEAAKKGIRLTYLPFIVKAVIAGLKAFPNMNSVLDEARNEIIVKHYYNIGIGAATPEGLTVPVIKDADQKDLLALAKEIQDLGEKAKNGKLSLDELQGSTFTITSLGALGGMFATPIINYPEVGILGIHKIEKRPVVRDDKVVVRQMMYVSLSFDHRVIDGDVGARFAQSVIEKLEHPST